MAYKLFCDKCNCEISEKENRWKINRIYLRDNADRDFDISDIIFLCEPCVEKFDKFIKGKE